MKNLTKHMPALLIGAVLAVVATCNSCSTFDAVKTDRQTQQFIVGAGTDLALALVIAQNPEFTPYANAVAEIVRDRTLTPDTLDAALAAYTSEHVEPDDNPAVGLVIDVISRQYRAYWETRAVPIEPDVVARSLADQIEVSTEGK